MRAKLVDSRYEKLNSMQIVQTALETTKSKYPPIVAYPAIITEMSQPNSMVYRQGNTLFSVLTGANGIGFFKALNADVASEYVKNSKEFCKWAYKNGLRTLVTKFDDPILLKLFKVISQDPPLKGMGYEVRRLKSGGYRVTLGLGNGGVA